MDELRSLPSKQAVGAVRLNNTNISGLYTLFFLRWTLTCFQLTTSCIILEKKKKKARCRYRKVGLRSEMASTAAALSKVRSGVDSSLRRIFRSGVDI